ncbi:MAG: family 10 glycosylhydrolase, partial [Terriglobales bacterium]
MNIKNAFPRICIAAMLWACAVPLAAEEKPRTGSATPEFRAVWVDAFHAGIRTPQEADKLVEEAASANFNALIVQVRRRGDSLYKNSLEPPLREAPYDPEFDALAYIVEKGHARGLEVHAWVNAMPIWRDPTPPTDANHVYNLHGPDKTGAASWLTASPEGVVKFPVGYFLDAGHPDAADYVARVCAKIVRNYKVDGLHLDYIRYPETTEALPRGSAVCYNGISLERFRRWAKAPLTIYAPPAVTPPPLGSAPTATAAGSPVASAHLPTVPVIGPVPAPDDPQWIGWRRQQLTQLVRRIYIEAKLANPKIKVSAAVIAWGKPPTDEADFENVSPMQRIFQNWHGWLEEGILDMSLPMNY